MNAQYLLDTSALIDMSKRELESLRTKGVELFGSPYSCWEMLCHLDEPDKFRLRKSNLLKFEYVNMLDNPQAAATNAILHRVEPNITDRELALACLGALQNSESLGAFYSSLIRDSKDHYRKIADVCDRARRTLDELESQYTSFVSKLVDHLATRSDIQDAQLHPDFILNLVKGEVNKIVAANPDGSVVSGDVVVKFYVYYGYIFYRSLHYIASKGEIDKNDFEDANICLHISTNTPLQLVTNDKGTLEALNCLRASTLNSDHLSIGFEGTVHDTSDLKQLAEVT